MLNRESGRDCRRIFLPYGFYQEKPTLFVACEPVMKSHAKGVLYYYDSKGPRPDEGQCLRFKPDDIDIAFDVHPSGISCGNLK